MGKGQKGKQRARVDDEEEAEDDYAGLDMMGAMFNSHVHSVLNTHVL